MPSLKSRLSRLLPILCLSGLLLSTACATKIVPATPNQLTADLSAEIRTRCPRPGRPQLIPGLFDQAKSAVKNGDFEAIKALLPKLELNFNASLAFSVVQEATINCESDRADVAVKAHDALKAEAIKLKGRLRD